MKSKFAFYVSLALFVAGFGVARATTFLELQSTYLGDGWFRYQMNVKNDPFFTQSYVPGIQIGFTNQVNQNTVSANWVNTDSANAYSSWSFSGGNSPTPPFEVTWTIRSSETAYKLQTNIFNGDAIAQLSLNIASIYPGSLRGGGVYSQNVIGCANLSSLVPCSPEQADGSPPNFVYTLKLAPDVIIKQLIQTNGNILGVDFLWDSEATFVLQGTGDFKNWTNLAYIWSYPPETFWVTNQSLNSRGSYFRLQLVTDRHTTNVPSLVSSAVIKPKIPGPPNQLILRGCQLTGSNLVVSVSSSPGQGFYLQALDSRLNIQQSRFVITAGSLTAVTFAAASLPNPVYFRAVLQ